MSQYQRSHEPIVWSLFGAGGMVVAFITPILIVLTGFLFPLLSGPESMSSTASLLMIYLSQPLVKLALWACISLQFFHALHRIHHGLHDLHVPIGRGTSAIACYGAASILSIVAGAWFWVL